MEPKQFVEEIFKISPLIRFSAIYFEGDFYSKKRDSIETHLDSLETLESMSDAVLRMTQREKYSQKIGNIHYVLAKYDELNRVTIPLGKDGLIMFSTELEAECELIAEKVIEFKKLTYLAKEIGKENFDVKVNMKSKGEMAQLVKNMNKMGTALKNTKKAKDVVTQQEMEMEKKIEKQKDEFVAMVSHELKNPLTPIKVYSSALKRPKFLGDLNEQQAEAVDSINFNALRLERMIGDLLDVQKLELGKITFQNQWIVVEEFMVMLIKNLKSQTEQEGGQLINHTKEKIIMKSDTPRLFQVFSNLINNSIDFIPKNKGIIEINAQNKKDKILFSVKDNGIGMTLETQKSLFQKFYQADTSITRKHGGTGLGLAICKGIVEGLGGEIWFESEVGKGTTFFFTIPRGTLDENIDSR